MPTADQIRAAVGAYCDAYARDDKQAFLDAFADDGVLVDPVGTPAHEGREALGGFWDMVHGMADSIRLDVAAVHVCGDEAAMVFTINALVGGGGMAIDAVDVFRVDDDGRIALMQAYWEMAEARPIE